MVYFKENCNFPRFQRGSIFFSKGSLGVQLFTGGGGGGRRGNCLFPIPILAVFPRECISCVFDDLYFVIYKFL